MHSTDVLRAAALRHNALITETLQALSQQLESATALLERALFGHRQILVCGNGGSAADAQHFVAELVGRYKKERPALRAIALTTDTSILTAVGNDYGYTEVFSRQVAALGERDDVLVLISTSGTSQNIVRAALEAHRKGMRTILLTGAKGAQPPFPVHAVIAVPSLETARVQEVHQLIYHAWCEYFDTLF